MSVSGKVLVVDDEAHIRKFVTLLIQAVGNIQVSQAANGTEALQVYAREQPQLVFLDVNMPRIDGLQTLRNLKRDHPACAVVMLTSLVNRQTVEACLTLGALGYLRKDNPPDDIAAQLRKFVLAALAPKPPPPVPPPPTVSGAPSSPVPPPSPA